MASPSQKLVQKIRVRLLSPLWRSSLRFWRWWSRELVATLPTQMQAAIAHSNKRVVITLDESRLMFTAGENATRQPLEGNELPAPAGTVVFALPTESVLRRPLNLPLAAEENLREVLGFEMDRYTPFTLQQVYYDYHITARHAETSTLAVDLVVTPKSYLDEVLATLRNEAIVPDVISTFDKGTTDTLPVNLLPGELRPSRQFSAPRLNTILASICILLLITALLLPATLKRQKIAQLEQEVSLAATLGQSSIELQREVERISETSRFLIEKKRSSVLVLKILQEVSRLLPDHTWLTRFDVNGPEIQLQGQSSSAAKLISLLESSPLFRDAQFRSPVVQVPRTDKERFHLSMQLQTAAAP